jgi:hypothetical protein
VTERDARYRRKLLVLLSSATFFESPVAGVLAALALALLAAVRRGAARSP